MSIESHNAIGDPLIAPVGAHDLVELDPGKSPLSFLSGAPLNPAFTYEQCADHFFVRPNGETNISAPDLKSRQVCYLNFECYIGVLLTQIIAPWAKRLVGWDYGSTTTYNCDVCQ